jgi:CDP-paratose 2-epimerase
MSVILITGSCGLVGSESVKFFLKKGYDVVGIDNNQRNFFFGKDGDTTLIKKELTKLKNYRHYNTDIRNKDSVKKIFQKYKKNIKLIIHSAAQPSHDWAKKFPIIDFEINASATLTILECTKSYCPEATFIFMSTNKVYGDNPNKLKLLEKKSRWEISKKEVFFKGINETMSIDNNTHSFFGVSKTYADLIVQEYGRNLGLKCGCFRAGCITGPNHAGAKLHGFLSYLVKASIQKKKYDIIGYKGKQVRDNIHSSDLINCFWEFFKRPKKGEIYNVGGGRFSNCSILEALTMVENICKIKIKKNYYPDNRVGDHIWYVSNMKKFKSHYPKWSQKYTTKKILKELILSVDF